MITNESAQLLQRTRFAFLWTRALSVPFWGMIYLLSVILYKNMHITPVQITLIITLKPLSALFAPYWSQLIDQQPSRTISHLVWANILRYAPFLFVPWIESSWIIIVAFGFYMMFYRGVIPTWMEIIKCNLPEFSRERLVGHGSVIDYCGSALLPLVLGVVLDHYPTSWKWLFFFTAALGLISTGFLYSIPILKRNETLPLERRDSWEFFKKKFFKPWKESYTLLQQRPDFASFQMGFMLGGAGLMIIQPSLPIFFIDTLNLSYTKMLLALAVCKGIGFAAATPFWVKYFRKWNIYYLSGIVTFLAALSLFVLLSAQFNVFLLYLAYGIYGIMQAGSDLSWHMSGPYFAKEKDSTLFSETNVLAVGIRGCIIPLIGSLICSLTGASGVMLLGGALCLLATWHLLRYSSSLALNNE